MQPRRTLLTLVPCLLIAFFARDLAGQAAKSAAAKSPSTKAAAAAPATLAVFATCNGGSASCTATAVCPRGALITSGWTFYLVPDSKDPAYGICGTGSAACAADVSSCTVTTKIEGCASPGWKRQSALVAINCTVAAAR
jgi:hypothetical protein